STNPPAAAPAVPNGRLGRDKRLRTSLETISPEPAAVAKAEGAAVDAEELLHRTVLVAKRTPANRGSMLQDLDRHRRTEIDAIAGPIIRGAARHRLPVPLTQAFYAVVRAREAAP